MERKMAARSLPPLPEASATVAAASLPVAGRRKSSLKEAAGKRRARLAASAGETAAECAPICCCCPCVLLNLLVDVLVRLPAGLIRRALQRWRKCRRKKAVGVLRRQGSATKSDLGVGCRCETEEAWPGRSASAELVELEKVMRENFHGAGFWRSPSQRDDC